MRFFALALILFLGSAWASAKEVEVQAEVDYYAPNTMSPAEARERAIEFARCEALRKSGKFSLRVSSNNISIEREDKNRSELLFYDLSQTDLNGEWVRDIDEPVVVSETPDDKNGRIYRVRVKGMAREVKYEPIDLDVRLLCNGCDRNRDQLRGNEYFEGDNFYLYFNSPVGGWLTVYLCDDDDAMTVQAILPYEEQPEKAYRVEADREYVFFSRRLAEPQHAEFPIGLKMHARKETDVNIVYVIFSPNEFARSSTSANKTAEVSAKVGGETVNLMPRETDFKRFSKWLGNSRKKDPQMQERKFFIKVSKPE